MKKLIAIVGLILLMGFVADRGYVFAKSPFENILEKLEQIQNTLDNQVVPKLDQCCPECPNKARLPRTGQTISYGERDDGALQLGVPWPNPRFTEYENGTVTDNLTGLIWTRNANIYGIKPWCQAIASCNSSSEGGYADWRLPNVRELQSLLDYRGENQYSMLPVGHPFTGIGISQTFFYWSSTSYSPDSSWTISFENGHMYPQGRNCSPNDPTGYLVWCVRGGN
jgi:hypothetical protein